LPPGHSGTLPGPSGVGGGGENSDSPRHRELAEATSRLDRALAGCLTSLRSCSLPDDGESHKTAPPSAHTLKLDRNLDAPARQLRKLSTFGSNNSNNFKFATIAPSLSSSLLIWAPSFCCVVLERFFRFKFGTHGPRVLDFGRPRPGVVTG
jgi:hypothetical protein